jgi:hypothetical protein
MGKSVDFVVVFGEGVRKRHYHETEKGKIIYFAVQLEVKVGEDWKVVLRYDCSHDYSHVDKYDVKGNRVKISLDLSFESALTFGDWDINENWPRYLEQFLRGVTHA